MIRDKIKCNRANSIQMKTVEINNTDVEGRIVLADCVATLTGAGKKHSFHFEALFRKAMSM